MSGETIGSFRNETNASSADVLNQTTNGGRHIFLFITLLIFGINSNYQKRVIQISFMI